MAEIVNKYVQCPKCKQQSSTDILISGNTVDDPELRAQIFKESVFRWKCKKCGFSSRYQHPLLYNDIEGRFMVYYIPKVSRPRVADDALDKEYSELGEVRKRIVPDINAMKEKILVFEKGLDDRALELTKLAVSDVVARETSHNVYAGYFTEIDEAKNRISFQFFVGGDKRSYIQTTRLEVYRRSLDIVKKHFPGTESGFLLIGTDWAKQALNEFRQRGAGACPPA